MAISDVRGENVIDMLADAFAPAMAIVSDEEVLDLMRKAKSDDFTDIARKAAPKLIKAHKDDLVDLMCALKRVERGEYLESLTAFSFLSDVMALITDREMLDFLSQPRGTRE